MGGNAFPHVDIVRIKQADVFPTIRYVVDTLQIPNFTYEYASAHLMGSAGKQATSGDIDFAINNHQACFVGETDLPVFRLRDIAARAREVLPDGHVKTKTLKGGQFQTAFPITGLVNNGYVQVDFIAGKPEWLMFSHYSPGLDVSPFKGVLISTMLGVLAKMRKEFEAFSGDQRVARVGLRYDLEKGLYRRWEYQKLPNQGTSQVTANVFETAFLSPRFSRLENVTNPEAVLELLFGQPVELDEVNTFEKLVAKIKSVMPDRFQEAKERFLVSAQTSSAANNTDMVSLALNPVWDV